jgi:hypothetical protein
MGPGLTALGCLLALLFVYLPCLPGGGFLIDDASLVGIPLLRAPISLSWLKTLFTPGSHIDFYPVRDLAYWIQIHVLGGDADSLTMTVFRATSLGLFALTLYFMGRILSRYLRPVIVSLSLVLFAVLPFHSEELMWASAQKDLLALLFGTMAVDQWEIFRRKQEVAGFLPRAVAITALLALSLMSKASLILLPAVAWLSAWLDLPAFRPEVRKRALGLASVLVLTAVAWGLVQVFVYGQVNDMRLQYPLPYRMAASAAALGRELAGLLWPPLNIVDVENWGDWLDHNRGFVPLGAGAWAVGLAAAALAAWRRNASVLLGLAAFAALYLPTSGLVFEHRNFYSVRYLEPLLLGAWFWATVHLGGLWEKRSRTRPGIERAVPGAAFFALLFFACFSIRESEAWFSSRTVFEKALSRHPQRLSLLAHYRDALGEEERWGRLDRPSLDRLKLLREEVRRRCGISSDQVVLPSGSESGDCFSTWDRVVFGFEGEAPAAFQNAAVRHEAFVARFLPERVERVRAKRRILEIAGGMSSATPSEVRELLALGVRSLPEERFYGLAALCLAGDLEGARSLRSSLLEQGLLEERDVKVSQAFLGAYLKKRGDEGARRAERLGDCLAAD